MGNQSSIQRLNFEDIQDTIKNKNKYVIINTLPISEQMCLIPNTIDISSEESTINNLVSQNNSREIIIYGRNSNDMTIYDKYEQLTKLGFRNIYVYPGGIFEWLCLQDIYSDELFPTTKKELDILKYKPNSKLNKFYITND
jgi:rhodanese-related sulfurtransferase